MKKPHILCIEDNPNDIALMERVFQKLISDLEVQFITNGQEAIEFLKSEKYKARKPKFILLDIKLPKANGLEVLKAVRADHGNSQIPVIMLSSSDRVDEIEKSYKLGCNSFIEKPKNFIALKKRLPLIVEYWYHNNI